MCFPFSASIIFITSLLSSKNMKPYISFSHTLPLVFFSKRPSINISSAKTTFSATNITFMYMPMITTSIFFIFLQRCPFFMFRTKRTSTLSHDTSLFEPAKLPLLSLSEILAFKVFSFTKIVLFIFT